MGLADRSSGVQTVRRFDEVAQVAAQRAVAASDTGLDRVTEAAFPLVVSPGHGAIFLTDGQLHRQHVDC